MRTLPSTTRLVVILLFAVIALAALAISAYVFAHTPEPNRDGRPATVAAFTALFFSVSLLCVIAGKRSLVFCWKIVERLVK